jgi:hypothetical protein
MNYKDTVLFWMMTLGNDGDCWPRTHAAFDAHLIGIDPDYRLHVSERLLSRNDGPMPMQRLSNSKAAGGSTAAASP